MKCIHVVKVGSLRDPNPETRGKVEVLDIPQQPLGDEDVRIKVAYCSICGSDPHLVENIFGWEPPFGIGHEVSGVIVELGPKATKKGSRSVTALPATSSTSAAPATIARTVSSSSAPTQMSPIIPVWPST